jgi:hypothetical protein
MEFKKLLEDAPAPRTKRVAVVIGRFNPPTKGHYAVINKVKKFIKDNPKLSLEAVPVVVVIGGGKSDLDKAKNPLSVDERILFMKASGNANACNFMHAKNAFEALTNCRNAGLEPIAIAAGSDRIDDYVRILNHYFKNSDDTPIKHYKVHLDRDDDAVEADPEEKQASMDNILSSMQNGDHVDTDLVSGSLARRAVELGYEKEFAEIVGLPDKPELAKKLFDKIKKALPPSTKEDDANV